MSVLHTGTLTENVCVQWEELRNSHKWSGFSPESKYNQLKQSHTGLLVIHDIYIISIPDPLACRSTSRQIGD